MVIAPSTRARITSASRQPCASISAWDTGRKMKLASAATSEEERKRYYGEAQKLIAEDSPYISLWNRTNVAIGQPAIRGLRINVNGNFESLREVSKGT